ncbi:MAG: S8 family serine peptidase [Deltaproteobacteria bacterium]
MRNQKILLILGLVLGVLCWLMPGVYAADPIRVAILDSGSNINFKEGVNFVDDSLRDFNGHGTLMAEIIKESCPSAEFYIVKVIGKNGLVIHEDAVILGIEWAISKNVKVINMSLRMKPSELLNEAIKKAHDKGIVMVSAAGNNDRYSDSYYSVLEAKAFSGSNLPNSEVAYPAKYPEVIAVGALDKRGKIYDQSVHSERVDLYFKGYWGRKAGTSVASAYVAGTIAHVISARASLNDPTKFIAQEKQMLELLDSVSLRCS